MEATEVTIAAPVTDAAALLRRLEVEDFLFHEAELLDRWRLEEWLELFTPDCRYVVPATDLPDGDPSVTLALIDDDFVRLRGRVQRLGSAKAYREFPWSRTRRLITNVRVRGGPEELIATASFALYRYRKGDEQVLVGAYAYRLATTPGGLRIRQKRSTLTAETLRPHGTVSIIL
jgi:p-cumate 2,3-dioxygenase beta subunit